MIRTTILLLISLLILIAPNGIAQDLRAEFAMARFNAPTEGPYLETYLKLKGSSLKLKNDAEFSHADVLITCKVTKGDNVVFEDTYKVKGPDVKKGEPIVDFIDQQRIPMKNGRHKLKMTIKDLNNPDSKDATISQEVLIQQKLLKVFLSDVQLIDTYTKTTEKNVLSKVGFDLVPFTSNFYPDNRKEITFYAEVYNTHRKIGSDGEFLVNMFVENSDDGRIVGNLRKYFKRKGAMAVPVLHTFPLEEIGSGNYNLVMEARDKKNELLDRKVTFFQRSSSKEIDYVRQEISDDARDLSTTFVDKYNRPEELEEYLRCLHPISTQEEISYVNRKVNFNDPSMMKEFMYNFWVQRNPENPEEAWLAYWKEVQKVNASYSTNIYKGYDTDRGRVYLQYGPPNTISPNYFEPNTYPYEIWHYYQLEDHLNAPQSNRKFIFANVDQGTKEFDLIHSDAKNEITNRRWNHDLHKRSSMSIDLDQEDAGGHYGGRSKDFYENPY